MAPRAPVCLSVPNRAPDRKRPRGSCLASRAVSRHADTYGRSRVARCSICFGALIANSRHSKGRRGPAARRQ